jgi:tRNA nucleotidyltransferase (CCA-adding enzyme)
LTVGDLAVTGDDLIAVGLKKGPAVGKTLKKLLELVLEDPTLNTRAQLLARIKE